jgi:hypothetical protein
MQRGAVDTFLDVVRRDHVARTYELEIQQTFGLHMDFVHLRPI